MNSTFKRTYLYCLITSLLLLISSCTHTNIDYSGGRLTKKTIASIQSYNATLKRFKGLAGIKLDKDHQKSSFRLAWAAENPDKLRLVVLVSGKTIETFAADGKHLFLKSHTDAHKFIRRRASDPDLEKLISIPVRTSQIISLLSGKIPLADYKKAKLITSLDGENHILELSKPWHGVVERIFLSDLKPEMTTGENITGFEMIKRGKSVYKVYLNKFTDVEGFLLPFEIIINSESASCKITITSYFTNPVGSPANFTIVPN